MKTIGTLQLHTLLLSVITEVKFGQPLAPNANVVKREFKKMVGLSTNASNQSVLSEIKRVYKENGLIEKFENVERKFKIEVA